MPENGCQMPENGEWREGERERERRGRGLPRRGRDQGGAHLHGGPSSGLAANSYVREQLKKSTDHPPPVCGGAVALGQFPVQ
jgi:hypothetical protein